MVAQDYSNSKARESMKSPVSRSLYDEAKQLLGDNRDKLDRISDALLERETLDTHELKLLVLNKPLPPLPTPVIAAKKDSPPKRTGAEAEPSGKYSGDKLPDPEPVPG